MGNSFLHENLYARKVIPLIYMHMYISWFFFLKGHIYNPANLDPVILCFLAECQSALFWGQSICLIPDGVISWLFLDIICCIFKEFHTCLEQTVLHEWPTHFFEQLVHLNFGHTTGQQAKMFFEIKRLSIRLAFSHA